MGEKAKAAIPEFIWLQPWCEDCAFADVSEHGRMWCEDDAWDKCDVCGLSSVRYAFTPEKGE